MALIKEIVNVAVHWRLPGNNATNAANEMLRQLGLPEELRRLFAQLRLNGGNYEWSHPLADWQALKDVPPSTQQEALVALQQARIEIVKHGRGYGENLIKVPNDSEYVFCRRADDGRLQLLITGWGFENSRAATPGGGSSIEKVREQKDVKLGFKIGDELVKGRNFHLATGSVSNDLTTGPDGYFNAGTLKVGAQLRITDLVSGKEFDLQIQQNKDTYVMDVSQHATVEVVLTRDGNPVDSAEKVTIDYHGQSVNLQSMPGQAVTAAFCLWNGEEATITAMGITAVRSLQEGHNRVVINAETPKAAVKIEMVHSDGQPYVSERVTVDYAGASHTLYTNLQGEAMLEVRYAQGQPCVVTTSLGQDQKELRAAAETVFSFREVEVRPLESDVRVRVLHADGYPWPEMPVGIDYNGAHYDLLTDYNGECGIVLPYTKDCPCTVNTGIGSDMRPLMAATENVFEFVEMMRPPQFDYHVQFIDEHSRPQSFARVMFRQNGNEWPVTLDEQGGAMLPNGAFQVGQPIGVTMYMPDTKVYNINFELEPDEYEYVIQTEQRTSHRWLIWLLVFLAILGVLSIVACALTDWSCAVFDPLMARLLH